MLAWVSWLMVLVAVALLVISTGGALEQRSQETLGVLIPLVFSVFLVRLGVTGALQPGRRAACFAMLCGILLWAVGSTLLNSAGDLSEVPFPSSAEAFFLPGYVGTAASLVFGRRRGSERGLAVWLETVIICGGAASLAGFVIASPLGGLFARDGIPLLLALLYPLLSVLLALVAIGQVALGQRGLTNATIMVVAGFVALAVADGAFVVELATGDYSAHTILDILYAAAFSLIVAGTCGPSASDATTVRVRARGVVMAVAGGLAVVVLAFNPAQAGQWFVTIPAVLTLTAAGARLLQALRQAQEAAEARRLSLTDDLTGLPNRRAVLEAVDRDLRTNERLALMLLDLDGFKDVNDSLGHSAGDQVLVIVGKRLEKVVAGAGMLSRLGGDEFAVVVPAKEQAEVRALATTLLDVLTPPVSVDGLTLVARASVGITERQEGDSSAIDLLRRADIAMYEAKSGRMGVSVYNPQIDTFSRDRLDMLAQLRNAVTADELTVWYQPQVDARTREVLAFEALIRWNHPTLGLLSPFHFLGEARRGGLMPALTERVMRLVIADAQRWIGGAGLPITLSFNCAPPELLGGSLLPQLYEALEDAKLPRDTILIEVTEDSFVSDPEQARVVLEDLREHGLQVAIDDYGTGFSSLAYLRDLPVQELKMDRSFVSTVLTDQRSRVIVESTCQMADAMGLRMVGEGIEDEETARALAGLGVDVLQGYYFAKPMPSDQVVGWLHERAATSDRAKAGLVPGPRGG